MRLNPRERSFVARVSLDEPLAALDVPPGYARVALAVHHRGAVIDVLDLPARPRFEPEQLWAAMGPRIWARVARGELRAAVSAAVGHPPQNGASDAPTVSVVVCTRDRPEQLAACLDSLLALDPPAHEILVVDNAPADDRTRERCAGLPVRYIVEPRPGQARARNRGILEATGDLVAFTDDDCVADAGWLAGVGGAFRDPLVMAATGFIGPLELEHPAQTLFERTMAFQRMPERRVFDFLHDSPVSAAVAAGAGANMIFRREAFAAVGPFAEDLGPGTPARSADDAYAFYRLLAAGYRIDYDPRRIVWHRHRAEAAALRRIVEDYGLSHAAYVTRCLLDHGELGGVTVGRWWVRNWLLDLRAAARRSPRRAPLALTWAQVRGAVRGPAALVQSARTVRAIPGLEPPSAGSTSANGGSAPGASARGSRVSVRAAEPPAVTVTIASRDRREALATTLRALAHQTLPPERFEAVVVLDGPTDDSAEMARALDLPYPLRVVAREHRGLAATRNDGARAATYPVIVFLDDDIVPSPELLAEHGRGHADLAADGMVMGFFPPARDGTTLFEMVVRNWWEDHFRRKAQPGHRWSFSDIVDGNSSMPRALFDRLGGFDERFPGGRRQDWELGVRMLRAGVPVAFRPEARGDHRFTIDLASGLRNQRQEGYNDVLIARKHPETRWELPFGRFRLAADAGRVPRRIRLRHPHGAALRGALTAAEGLERLHFRGRWLRLVSFLLDTAYLDGAREALGADAALRAFLDPRGAVGTVEELDVPLGGRPATAPRTGPAPAEVVVRIGDQRIARIPAVGRDGQWDAEELVQRVVGVTPAAQAALMLGAGRVPGGRR